MLKFTKYILILRFILLISIFINININFNDHLLIKILLFGLILIMMINGYMIHIKLKKQTKLVYISMFLRICAAAMLQYLVSGIATTIYMYCILFELFQFEKNIFKILLLAHSSLYFLVDLLNQKAPVTENFFLYLGIQLLAYFGTCGMLYNQKTVEVEKEEVKQLNEKLKLANIKLQEYAIEIEEITISKERTRVAQELHDSLGHSLMALSMHLEFAKKICNAKPQKVEEVLEQSEKIAKSSISDLRKAVALLNSELQIKDLDASIEKLINNFYLFSNIKITFTKNKSLDELNLNIKTSIFRTVQECITNSLKHGNATEINIKILIYDEKIELLITDNGIGCNNIIKSTGLTGIETRISSLGGNTYYFSHKNLGFGIKISIPI